MAFALSSTAAASAALASTAAAQRTCAQRSAAPAGPAPARALAARVALGGPVLAARAAAPRAPARTAAAPALAALSTGRVKITIQGKHLEVTPAINDYAEEKISHALAPFEEALRVREVDAKFSARGGEKTHGPKSQRVEVTVYTKKHVFRAEEAEESLYASIDKVADKLQRKLRKSKERAMGKTKGATSTRDLDATGTAPAALQPSGVTGTPQLPPEVIRTKYFEMPPMSVDAAIEKLEAVGHDFYVFTNEETGLINVVYTRNTPGFGLIVPRPEN